MTMARIAGRDLLADDHLITRQKLYVFGGILLNLGVVVNTGDFAVANDANPFRASEIAQACTVADGRGKSHVSTPPEALRLANAPADRDVAHGLRDGDQHRGMGEDF